MKRQLFTVGLTMLIGAGCASAPERAPTNANVAPPERRSGVDITAPQAEAAAPSPTAAKSVTINYDGRTFSPSSVTIAKGGTVTFRNESGEKFWPASDPHPVHSGYPEKGCKASTFDACGPIADGSSWSFTFNEVGSWKFHDHLNAIVRGSVTVN